MACVDPWGLLYAGLDWFVQGHPLLRVLVLIILAKAIDWVNDWLSRKAPSWIERVSEKHWILRDWNLGAYIARFLLWLLAGILMLATLPIAALMLFAFVQLVVGDVMPPFLQIVATYHCQMLDFVMVLATASSILLVYTSTIEEHARLDKEMKSKSIRRAKKYGLVCVILSVTAPFVAPFSSLWGDYMLAFGVITFLVEAWSVLELEL
jgi:hypothetical protein